MLGLCPAVAADVVLVGEYTFCDEPAPSMFVLSVQLLQSVSTARTSHIMAERSATQQLLKAHPS